MNTTIITITNTNSMNRDVITEKIKLWGIVQGVGFRPFVAKIADRLSMKGEVLNIGGLVEIKVTDTKKRIDEFIQAICDEKPEPAEIVHIARYEQDYTAFDSFTILHSGEGDDEVAMIPADLSICPSCLAELKTKDNPRYRHPFISCMVCGPRYTIIDRIPYDRDNTAMIDWPMCGFCEGEYTSLADRRYHAQTISCHSCGPVLLCRRQNGDICDRERAVSEAAELLAAGRVIAFKSTGGYNLMADPFNPDAVAALREIKAREQKPFAVMFRDIDEIKKISYVNEVEERLLESSAKPIILLERKPAEQIEAPAYAKSKDELLKSRFVGSFLPSMGAQHLILEAFGGPLIATSANVSDMPMIKDDGQMMELMNRQPLIAAMIYNERDIRVRADDSVVRVIDGNPQMIRRSKGYAPVPLFVEVDCDKGDMIFAAGGQLKNSFALTKGQFVYMSQYFGDMDSLENREIYQDNVSRMEELFRIKPDVAVCDMHPAYAPSLFAQKLGIETVKVQHHHAHIASVMAEHNIEGAVIGVSFDGTGYGADGNVWGGEILICEGSSFKRSRHLKYIRMIGGDGSMKEAWKSALCYQYTYENEKRDTEADEFEIRLDKIMEYAAGHQSELAEKNKALVYGALSHRINNITSSSMGRLFDAVSALLGIKEYNDYEGQCAIMLEDAAARCETEAEKLAYDFHMQAARSVLEQCINVRNETGINKAALSGGVFQNRILTEKCLELLRDNGVEVYCNISVSPNDGGIALGQSYIGMKILEERRNGN